MVYQIKYLGNTIDETDSFFNAEIIRTELVRKVMNDELPMFLTRDDFEDRNDCYQSFKIVEVEDETL
jgi:hypothetical protein